MTNKPKKQKMQSQAIVPRAKLGTYVSPILESRRRPRSAKLRNDHAKQRSSLHEPPSFQVGEIGDWRRITPNDAKYGRFAQSTNALEHFSECDDNEKCCESSSKQPETTLFHDNFILRKSTLELSRHLSHSQDDDFHLLNDDTDDDIHLSDNYHHHNIDDDVVDDMSNNHNDDDAVLVCDNVLKTEQTVNHDKQILNDRTNLQSKTPVDDEGVIDDDDRHHFDSIHKSHYAHIDSKSLSQSMDEADSLISSMLIGSSFTGSSAGASSPWRLRRGVGLFSSKYSTQTAANASKSASLTFRNVTGNGPGNSNSSLMLVPGVYAMDEDDQSLHQQQQQQHHHQQQRLLHHQQQHHHHHQQQQQRRNSLTGTGKSLQNGKSPVNRKRMMLSAKSHSNLVYSSSSGCSTQSSSASSQTSLSQHFSRLKTRSSLREATQNFREFVHDYEQGLIDAIYSVEQQQRPSPESVCEEENENVENIYNNHCITPDYNNDCDDGSTTNESTKAPLELSQLNSSLRLQLENVRSLREKYETGCRTSEALEKLMKLTKQKRECDKEYRENERLLCEIQNQLEAMIGTFKIRVEDLVGFARICPRDNYEIEFRHGKTRKIIRIRIGKSLERIFLNDVQEIEFQGALKPIVVCRLREVKSRWRKNVTLGETSISMGELLTAVACGRQILLDANASGTLKLRILCTWIPKELKSVSNLNDKNNKNKIKSSTLANVHEGFVLNTSQNNFSKIPRPFTKNFSNDLSKSMLTLPTQDSLKSSSNNNSKNYDCFDNLKRSKSTLSFDEHSEDDEDDHDEDVDDDSLILTDDDDDDVCQNLPLEQISTRKLVEGRIEKIVDQLKNLEDSLEDYRGQFAEFTMMSLAVQKLLEIYGHDNVNSMFDSDEVILDDVQNALAEFDFLEESDSGSSKQKSSTKKPKLNVVDEYLRRSKATTDEAIERSLLELDSWNIVLFIHLENALEQLIKIGSWILKSREREALARIRVNTFAFDNIYQQLRYPGKSNPIGKDVRVMELLSFAQRKLGVQWILSWSQLCETLSEMIKEKLDLDQEWDDDSACYASEWLCGKIVTYEKSKISLFDVRAFFELEMWKSTSSITSRRSSTLSSTAIESLSLRKLFEISLDLDSLTRRSRKLSTQSLERILFDKFNFETIWLPADVSLAVVEILYDSHGQEKQNKPSTSEVKKWNRLKEIRKICTNWLRWHIQEGHIEIKEHILSGLEASSPLTRRFSCYGIMFLLKLIKKSNLNSYDDSKNSTTNGNTAMNFVGKELDCLLYIAMEDVDGRVREEARRALKCLGHLGEERLKQIERNRMGFLDNGSLSQNGKKLIKNNISFNKEHLKSSSIKSSTAAATATAAAASSRCRVGGSVPDDLHRL